MFATDRETSKRKLKTKKHVAGILCLNKNIIG